MGCKASRPAPANHAKEPIHILPIVSDQLTLSSLPPDIVRRIIRIEGISMDKMRLISKMWHSLVLEYCKDRESFPDGDICQLCPALNMDNWFVLVIILQPRNDQFFKNWLGGWKQYSVEEDNSIKITRCWQIVENNKDGDGDISLELHRYLSRFRRFNSLQINHTCKRMRSIIVKTFANAIRVYNLTFYVPKFDFNERYFSLKLLQMRSISSFGIQTDNCAPSYLRQYLLKIAVLVSDFVLVEGTFQMQMLRGKMFGLPYAFWSDVAFEMVEAGIMAAHFYRGDQPKVGAWSHLRYIMYYMEP